MKKLIKLFTFSGNAKRARWLQYFLIALLFWFGAAWVDETYLAPNLCLINENWICYLPGEVREGITLDMIVAIILWVPFFAITVRRLNSHGKTPLLALLAVPLLVLLAIFLYWPELMIETWQLIAAIVVALPLFYLMLTEKKDAVASN